MIKMDSLVLQTQAVGLEELEPTQLEVAQLVDLAL
jgi:hypothetical protein